jgi:hypothetical protein
VQGEGIDRRILVEPRMQSAWILLTTPEGSRLLPASVATEGDMMRLSVPTSLPSDAALASAVVVRTDGTVVSSPLMPGASVTYLPSWESGAHDVGMAVDPDELRRRIAALDEAQRRVVTEKRAAAGFQLADELLAKAAALEQQIAHAEETSRRIRQLLQR